MKEEKSIEELAEEKAEHVVALFKAAPDDLAQQNEALYDLRLETVRSAAALTEAKFEDDFLRGLAHDLPEYNIEALYQTRASLPALVSAILAGWLFGGFLATLLGFFGLGGEILRPCAIFGFLWAEEYFSTNQRARKIFLAAFGLGGLGRLAAALGSGAMRVFSFTSLRRLIFGGVPRPNIFKCLWLWLGAVFLCIFFARRRTSINYPALRESLLKQIKERLVLSIYVFKEVANLQALLETGKKQAGERDSYCPRKNCELVNATLSLLDTLDQDKASWLSGILKRIGYEVGDGGSLVWNSSVHAPLYEAIGAIADGDKCLVLRRPCTVNGKTIRGLVQRLPDGVEI